MKNLKTQERRAVHLYREAFIGAISSFISIFTVLPYLKVSDYSPLTKVYLELITTPIQVAVYFLLAALLVLAHVILKSIFYYVRDISPQNVKSILINQVIYGVAILGFAYHYCSRPSKYKATIFERFIENKETFYVILFFILFYWIGNVLYFNSKYFKKLKP